MHIIGSFHNLAASLRHLRGHGAYSIDRQMTLLRAELIAMALARTSHGADPSAMAARFDNHAHEVASLVMTVDVENFDRLIAAVLQDLTDFAAIVDGQIPPDLDAFLKD